MLNPDEISAYVDGDLDDLALQSFEDRLRDDPEELPQIEGQCRLDLALKAVLGPPAQNEGVKQSILAVIGAASIEDLGDRVLDAAVFRRKILKWLLAAREHLVDAVLYPFRRPVVLSWSVAVIGLLCVGWWVWSEFAFNAPRLAAVSPGVILHREGGTQPAVLRTKLRPGDELQLEPAAFATVELPDGTRLEVLPGARLQLPPGSDGEKEFLVPAGTVTVRAAPQTPDWPLRLRTPHAYVTVVGTVFHVEVTGGESRLDVRAGIIRVAGASNTPPMEVIAGQLARAATDGTVEIRAHSRDARAWPFGGDSPWNRPLGSGARFDRIAVPSFSGRTPLTDTVVQRSVFAFDATAPLRQIPVPNRPVQEVHFADDWPLPPLNDLSAVGILSPAGDALLEFRQLTRLPSGRLQARYLGRTDLRGPGMGTASGGGVADFGGSLLSGALRQGELTNGIRHALAMNVPARELNRNAIGGRPYIWPATRAGPSWQTSYSERGSLHLGSLLAIPPSVDLKSLGVGDSGPGHELARALQDYGAYITEGSVLPVKFFTVDEGLPANMDDIVSRLVPQLRLVVNNTPESAGGGFPRRPPAPEFQSAVR